MNEPEPLGDGLEIYLREPKEQSVRLCLKRANGGVSRKCNEDVAQIEQRPKFCLLFVQAHCSSSIWTRRYKHKIVAALSLRSLVTFLHSLGAGSPTQ